MPFRIALVVAFVFGVAYLTVLKPSDEPAAPQAPGVEGLTSAVDKANGAAATAEAANAQREAAAGQTTPAASAAPAAGSAPAAKGKAATPAKANAASDALKTLEEGDKSAKILRQLAAGKTAVILFSSADASDDQRVRRIVRQLDRHRGKVVVHRIALSRVADFGAITRGVQITQAPTLLVMGGDLKARRIVGYTDRTEVNQLVNDVSGLRTRIRPSSYRSLVERSCATAVWNVNGDVGSLANRYSRGGDVLAVRDDVRSVLSRLKVAKVPSRFGTFHSAWVGELRATDRALSKVERTQDRDDFRAAFKRVNSMRKRVEQLAGPLGLECYA